jgi:hypothetical protein
LLAYEHKRGIQSSLFYFKRTAIYVAAASLSDAAGEWWNGPEVARFGKGLSWGLCFLSPFLGLLLGSLNGLIGYTIEPLIL